MRRVKLPEPLAQRLVGLRLRGGQLAAATATATAPSGPRYRQQRRGGGGEHSCYSYSYIPGGGGGQQHGRGGCHRAGRRDCHGWGRYCLDRGRLSRRSGSSRPITPGRYSHAWWQLLLRLLRQD